MATLPSIDTNLSTRNADGEIEIAIAYDIRDDARRKVVREICESQGRRVQRSVFEFTISDEQYGKLVGKLTEVLDHDQDSLCAYLLPQPTGETVQKWRLADPKVELQKLFSELTPEEKEWVIKEILEE